MSWAESLSSAMATLRVQASPKVWNTSALGTPANGSILGMNPTGSPSTIQVKIQWKPILFDVVQGLAGTEPVYTFEETTDVMFRSRVGFDLPLDRHRNTFQNFVVIGIKCSTLSEAESEASVAALAELQYGHFSMRVVDVSVLRCRQLEERCYKVLANAAEVYHGLTSVLTDWEEFMNKAEERYAPLRSRAVENICHRVGNHHPDMMPDVADQLAMVTRENYLKLQEMALETEAVKTYIDKVHDRVKYFFCEPSIDKDNEYRGSLPREIKICMKLVLQEMIASLGWAGSTFNIICVGPNLYACETCLFLDHGHAGTLAKTLTITGPEGSSEEEAVQSSCKAAILALENDKSICLVDLNYNHRSHGELYVVEAKEAMQIALSMASRVIGQWQAMVDQIRTLEEHCEKAAADHLGEEEGSFLLKTKCSHVVSCLRKICLADLQFAKYRLKNVGAWI